MKIVPRGPSDGVMSASLIELRGLQLYAQLMEEKAARVEDMITRPGLPEVPGGVREQIAEATAQGVVPELLRRSLVLSLHATLEYSVLQAVRILDGYADPPGFDSQGLKEASRHLEVKHEYRLLEPIGDERAIRVLVRLRHALMHALGSRFAISDKRWGVLKTFEGQFGGFRLNRNRVVLEPELFPRLYEPTARVIVGLVQEVRKRIDAEGRPPAGRRA